MERPVFRKHFLISGSGLTISGLLLGLGTDREMKVKIQAFIIRSKELYQYAGILIDYGEWA
jgi:hypothetical protein